MNKLREIMFWKYTEFFDNNIPVSLRVDFENLYLNLFKSVLSLVG